ncbi:MAG: hypothetical protein QM639_19520 [Rhodocyclaceae bacterium]
MIRMTMGLVVLAAMAWAGIARAQQFNDASNLAEAVGMVKMTEHTSGVMRNFCVQHYPALASFIDTDLQRWRVRESRVLDQVERHWRALEAQGMEGDEILSDGTRAVLSDMAFIARLAAVEPGESVEGYCRRSFDDLAAGAWRRRTPHAYGFLDQVIASYP